MIKPLKEFANLNDNEALVVEETLKQCEPYFKVVDKMTALNQIKILCAFQKENVADFHLNGSTGYGYGDTGREILEKVWATIFSGEKALVRSNIASGTHAIALALFGNLLPGDELLSISGMPYDTLQTIIGKENNIEGSLRELNISHKFIDLIDDDFDEKRILENITDKTKMIAIQRSRGYSWRKSLSIAKMERIIKKIKEKNPKLIIFVDNCYGEFVEDREPLEIGADLIAGSLIKNPGGGLAPRGGYLVGKEEYVNRAAMRLMAPGIADDVGSALDFNRPAFQGLFMAPLIVEQALKGAIFTSCYLEKLGYMVSPQYFEERTDIIQAIVFNTPDKLRRFSEGIQKSSPLESYVTPYDALLPGYDDPVIMAGGTFIQGSSIELSIDGPMREPYIGYIQGGLSFFHILASVCRATKGMEGF